MKENPMQAATERRHEATVAALGAQATKEMDPDGIHYTLDSKQSPLVEVANQVFAEHRKKKAN